LFISHYSAIFLDAGTLTEHLVNIQNGINGNAVLALNGIKSLPHRMDIVHNAHNFHGSFIMLRRILFNNIHFSLQQTSALIERPSINDEDIASALYTRSACVIAQPKLLMQRRVLRQNCSGCGSLTDNSIFCIVVIQNWKELDMQNSAEVTRAFRDKNLFTKENILDSFEAYMECIEDGEEGGMPEKTMQRRMDLCRAFYERVKACKLPKLTELWWFYGYLFEDDRIVLELCTASDVDIDDKGNIGWSTTVEHVLISQECKMLSVEEFASDWGVEPVTVRQWIRRGKLRTAKKVGRNWLIPELADRPVRGYESAHYLLIDPKSIQIPEYPLVSVCDTISIMQNETDRKLFTVLFRNGQTGFDQQMTLDRKEVETLEYALISSGKARSGSHIQLVPLRSDYGE
jgi:hypothetical protein